MNSNDLTPTGATTDPRRADFADRVIMVTGATSGIGRAVARELVRAGATVILHGRSEKALEALVSGAQARARARRRAARPRARAGPEYQALTTEIETRYGRLDGLLHNATILGRPQPDRALRHRPVAARVARRSDRAVHSHALPLAAAAQLRRCVRAVHDEQRRATRPRVLGRVRGVQGRHGESRAGVGRRARKHADSRQLINPGRNAHAHARAGLPRRESGLRADAGEHHAGVPVSARRREPRRPWSTLRLCSDRRATPSACALAAVASKLATRSGRWLASRRSVDRRRAASSS